MAVEKPTGRGLGLDAAKETATLARLNLDDAACKQLSSELEAVLEHMACLDEVDTDGVEPLTHVLTDTLRLRADEIEESFEQSDALAAAPKADDGCFVVPAAIPAKR